MSITVCSAINFSIIELTKIMNRCFEDYVVPVNISADYFLSRFVSEGISFADSLVWLKGEKAIALALITLRGNDARLAAFAIIPEYRGKGLAKKMIEAILLNLRKENKERIYLEVICGNDKAIKLYQSFGFNIKNKLIGFKSSNDVKTLEFPYDKITYEDFLRIVHLDLSEHIAWQISPESLNLIPCDIFLYDDNSIIAIDKSSLSRQIRYIYVYPGKRRKGIATNLLREISFHHTGISTPVAIFEGLRGLYFKAGYEELPLKQYEMCLIL